MLLGPGESPFIVALPDGSDIVHQNEADVFSYEGRVDVADFAAPRPQVTGTVWVDVSVVIARNRKPRNAQRIKTFNGRIQEIYIIIDYVTHNDDKVKVFSGVQFPEDAALIIDNLPAPVSLRISHERDPDGALENEDEQSGQCHITLNYSGITSSSRATL